MVTVSQRNARVSGATTGSGNPGNDLKRDTVGRQLFDFFTTTAEDERVATFESQNTFALLGQVNQLLVDLILRQCMLSPPLADVNTLGITAA